jgi:hypothetical protein
LRAYLDGADKRDAKSLMLRRWVKFRRSWRPSTFMRLRRCSRGMPCVNDPVLGTGEQRNLSSAWDGWGAANPNQAMRTLWTAHSTDEAPNRQYNSTVAALVGIEPRDEEGRARAPRILYSEHFEDGAALFAPKD